MCFSFILIAQSKKYTQVFQEYYDYKPIHFGFQFGFSSGRYFTNFNGSLPPNTTYTSPGEFGFFVGGTINYTLNQFIEAKSGINVALYSRKLQENTINSSQLRSRESTWLEMPFLVKFRSIRRKNHRAFLIAGTKVSWESNKRAATNLLGKQFDLTLEYGFGFERFNKFFKFTPEIRFSNGLLNMYLPTGSYTLLNGTILPPLPSDLNLKSNTITLILNFE